MPYKSVIIGIYAITTPSGSTYIGSSNNIYRRWSEHRGNLKRNKHHSQRLQNAWNKYNGNLKFEVLHECSIDQLVKMEQSYIVEMSANLNTTNYVNNVWCNPETRAKLGVTHKSVGWRESRRKIAQKTMASKRRPVDCSNGVTYPSLCDAAIAFDMRPSGILALAVTQRQGKLGVRFKFASEEWRQVLPHYEQVRKTRITNGSYGHSSETKQKISLAHTGRVAHNKGTKHSESAKEKMRMAQQKISVIDNKTGIQYISVIEASRLTGICRTQVRRMMVRGERFAIARTER